MAGVQYPIAMGEDGGGSARGALAGGGAPLDWRSRGTGAALSTGEMEAIRAALSLFVEDDIARGVAAFSRLFCDACQRARPAAGFIQYGRYATCNACAIEYEVARARGLLGTPGQFVRDKRFGEGDAYVLPG
jgi:hypothetical protein